MDACESLGVIVSIKFDMDLVSLSKLRHHVLDVSHALLTASHSLSGEVRVTTGAIPVFEELGCEGDSHVEVFSDSLQKISGDP